MKTRIHLVVIVLTALILVSTSAFSQTSGSSSRSPADKDKPITALPYTPSLDLSAMDKSADPCVDFYQYTCGGWQKKNPIPNDQVSWSVYGKLYQDNLIFLRGILEQAAAEKGQRDPVTQKIGD